MINKVIEDLKKLNDKFTFVQVDCISDEENLKCDICNNKALFKVDGTKCCEIHFHILINANLRGEQNE